MPALKDTKGEAIKARPVKEVTPEHNIELPKEKPDVLPLRGKLLVKRFEADSISKGGIVLPGQAKKRPAEGIVIAVGPGKVLETGAVEEPLCKEGYHILFQPTGGIDIKVDGNEYAILTEDEVLCAINTQTQRTIPIDQNG
jgi:chaperonin GroES